MYQAKLWDEDKWNIHSGSYAGSKYGSAAHGEKKDDKNYHEQKYGSEEKNLSSDYLKKDEQKQKDEKKEDGLFDSPEEEKKQEDLKEEEIPFKAAGQLFSENIKEAKKADKKKNVNSIEDAIKKAIEEEKKIIIMDS